jgi:molecular chaperone DnaK
MSKVVGFDFGTTNSLISIILKHGEIKSYTDGVMPHPSVVCYSGDSVIAGRKAKDRLDANVMGISGNVVRSPKALLDRDYPVDVAGREKHPIDIVADLVRFLKNEALQQQKIEQESDQLTDFNRAVVTIPVGMCGKTRKSLRNAILKAGINIVTFVHEPLAALYGYFRQLPNMGNELLKRNGQLILVFDWGGGTLDLTLCKVFNGMLIQVQNVGDNEVGGDRIDEALLNFVLDKHCEQHKLKELPLEQPNAKAKLLNRCETVKIELSNSDRRQPISILDYFSSESSNDSDIEVWVTRQDLEKISQGIINRGIGCIKRLSASAGIDESSISLCLATGGMIKTPVIEQKLQEIFGLSRLVIAKNGDRIISEGAAWIAHDDADLVLAKTVEIKEARDSYFPIFKQGRELPKEGRIIEENTAFYCVDPRDGFAKFQICRTEAIHQKRMASDPRQTYDNLTVKVDKNAKPFYERLLVQSTIDDNLILNVRAESELNDREQDSVEIHDLEFCIAFPNSVESEVLEDNLKKNSEFPNGAVTIRSNVTQDYFSDSNLPRHEIERRKNLCVPGELLYQITPQYFDTRNNPPEIQVKEKMHYELCPICRKSRKKIREPKCHCRDKGN